MLQLCRSASLPSNAKIMAAIHSGKCNHLSSPPPGTAPRYAWQSSAVAHVPSPFCLCNSHLLHALLRDTPGRALLLHTVFTAIQNSLCTPPFVPISPPPCTAQQCAWQSSAPQTWRRHQSSLRTIVALIVCFACVVCVYVLFVGCAMSAAACNNPAPLPAAGRVVCASRIYHTMQVTANTIPT